MKKTWLSLRKDVFVRDLFHDFFEAKLHFDKIQSGYKKSGNIAFSILDEWVGTESRKGPLWTLKDQSHTLYRSGEHNNTLYENLFDWTLGSIFHESMKLKEDAYQVESYKPLLELEYSEHSNNKALSSIIHEYYVLIEKANQNLTEELESVHELFAKAIYHLRQMVITYKDNALLLRYLLDNSKRVCKIFGKNAWTEIVGEMFNGGEVELVNIVGAFCMEKGWYEDAHDYLKQSLTMDKKNKVAQNHLNELKNILDSVYNKEQKK